MFFRSDEILPVGRKGIHKINTAGWRKKRPIWDLKKCIKCSLCYQYCPVFSIYKTEDGYFLASYEYCKGCGICEHECPAGAIKMIQEPTEGE